MGRAELKNEPNNMLANIVEASLMSYGKPLNIKKIKSLFNEKSRPNTKEIRKALSILQEKYHSRGSIELKEVASGWRFQVKIDYADWVTRLWDEKTPRYSKAFLETLSLIAYKQPITRGEIEEIRGVSVSSGIIKSMLEREWVRVFGHKEVPGRPAMYGTTRQFLDYFNLKSLSELPTLVNLEGLGFNEEEPENKPELILVE